MPLHTMLRMSDGVRIRVFPGERALLLAHGVARDDTTTDESTQHTPPRKQARKRTPRKPKSENTNT